MSSPTKIIPLRLPWSIRDNGRAANAYVTRAHWHGNNFSVIMPLLLEPDDLLTKDIRAISSLKRIYVASDGSLVADFGICTVTSSHLLHEQMERLLRRFTDRKVVVEIDFIHRCRI